MRGSSLYSFYSWDPVAGCVNKSSSVVESMRLEDCSNIARLDEARCQSSLTFTWKKATNMTFFTAFIYGPLLCFSNILLADACNWHSSYPAEQLELQNIDFTKKIHWEFSPRKPAMWLTFCTWMANIVSTGGELRLNKHVQDDLTWCYGFPLAVLGQCLHHLKHWERWHAWNFKKRHEHGIKNHLYFKKTRETCGRILMVRRAGEMTAYNFMPAWK